MGSKWLCTNLDEPRACGLPPGLALILAPCSGSAAALSTAQASPHESQDAAPARLKFGIASWVLRGRNGDRACPSTWWRTCRLILLQARSHRKRSWAEMTRPPTEE